MGQEGEKGLLLGCRGHHFLFRALLSAVKRSSALQPAKKLCSQAGLAEKIASFIEREREREGKLSGRFAQKERGRDDG